MPFVAFQEGVTMPLPPPDEQDARWALRLWSTLVIDGEQQAGGVWDMPGVGRYRRMAADRLTLVEIHGDVMQPDALGIALMDKHDWISLLGAFIGWTVDAEVEVIKAIEDAQNAGEPALEDIGKVVVCPTCSLIYTLHGPHAGERLFVDEEGTCLNRDCDDVLPEPFRGVLCVVDDRAAIAKMEAEEMIRIAIDEDEYPVPEGFPEPSFPTVDDESQDGTSEE